MGETCRPYRQGHFDSLCGIYAIINAIQFVTGSAQLFSEADASRLFAFLMHQARERWGEASILDGLDDAEVWYLARQARRHLQDATGLRLMFDRPFRAASIRSLSELVKRLGPVIGPEGKGAVICPLDGLHAHWTVVTAVLPGFFRIADSNQGRRYRFSRCRVLGEEAASANFRILEPMGIIVTRLI